MFQDVFIPFDPDGDHRGRRDQGLLDALAGLGVVLCLAPPGSGPGDLTRVLGECALGGRLHGQVLIEPTGVVEALAAITDDGVALLRLLRVPDSDYLAWEQVLDRVPVSQTRHGWWRGWRDPSACRLLRLASRADGMPQLLQHDCCSMVTWRALQRLQGV